jgi:hypothetical protein
VTHVRTSADDGHTTLVIMGLGSGNEGRAG